MTCEGPTPESSDLQDYLEASEIIDWKSPEIRLLADVLVAGATSDVEKAKRIYEWVRDEIPHSADAGHETVTCRSSIYCARHARDEDSCPVTDSRSHASVQAGGNRVFRKP